MQDIVYRLQKIMSDESLTAASFADSMGIGRPVLSHVLGGRNNPSLQLILKILETYPAYTADWLLLGKVSPDASPYTARSLETSIQAPVAPIAEPEVKAAPLDTPTKHDTSDQIFNQILVLHPDKTYDVYNQR